LNSTVNAACIRLFAFRFVFSSFFFIGKAESRVCAIERACVWVSSACNQRQFELAGVLPHTHKRHAENTR